MFSSFCSMLGWAVRYILRPVKWRPIALLRPDKRRPRPSDLQVQRLVLQTVVASLHMFEVHCAAFVNSAAAAANVASLVTSTAVAATRVAGCSLLSVDGRRRCLTAGTAFMKAISRRRGPHGRHLVAAATVAAAQILLADFSFAGR